MDRTEIDAAVARIHEFLEAAPLFERFAHAIDDTQYARLPDDWLIGTADIVSSTAAIAAGRYKAVNMAGAAAIAAVMNAIDTTRLAYVFGGDGAEFLIPEALRVPVEKALSALITWCDEDMSLEMRAALVPVRDARDAGFDVRVARLGVSDHVSFTMFAGGGASWAERQAKSGHYLLPAAPAGSKPNLEGLSCRWKPVAPDKGRDIVSIIAVPGPRATPETFGALVHTILNALGAESGDQGHPIAGNPTRFAFLSSGYAFEVRADHRPGALWLKRAKVYGLAAWGWLVFRTGIRIGGFDPALYRADLAANADYRKFDDGLKLTVDSGTETTAAMRMALDAAYGDGVAWYGLHTQDRALMTCIVPSALARDHVHFVDGAGGGYARAAELLKAQMDEKTE